MKTKVLREFEYVVKGQLSNKEIDNNKKAINLHYLGEEDCNHWKDGRLVAKFPDKETDEFKDANYLAMIGGVGHTIKIKLQLMSDGTIKQKK